jgi:formylglycine-generating enzyme required for sulfatase activity
MARLNGKQIGDLQQALLDAFSLDELDRLLKNRLDRERPDLSLKTTRPAIVQDVIEAAERQGWTANLVRAAAEERPGLPELQALATRLLAQLDAATVEGDLLPELRRQDFEPCVVPIPAGAFLMGSKPGQGFPEFESPQQRIEDLPPYYIGKYPVTNDAYRAFLKVKKWLARDEMRWDGQSPPAGKGNHPVSGVTWYDALDYCRWLTEATERNYTLPNEAQWEKAARGADGRVYPWGNDWDPARCHTGQPDTAPVDAYPPQSIYGCYDLVGNVREWTCSLWGLSALEPDEDYRYPWKADERNHLHADSAVRRVYRGGAATDRPDQLRCASRSSFDPALPGPKGKRHGFRVVLIP